MQYYKKIFEHYIASLLAAAIDSNGDLIGIIIEKHLICFILFTIVIVWSYNHIEAIQMENALFTATKPSTIAIFIAHDGDHDNSAEKSEYTNLWLIDYLLEFLVCDA